jgi:hypothetical protein
MSLSEENARRNKTRPGGEQKENHEKKRGKKLGEGNWRLRKSRRMRR